MSCLYSLFPISLINLIIIDPFPFFPFLSHPLQLFKLIPCPKYHEPVPCLNDNVGGRGGYHLFFTLFLYRQDVCTGHAPCPCVSHRSANKGGVLVDQHLFHYQLNLGAVHDNVQELNHCGTQKETGKPASAYAVRR